MFNRKSTKINKLTDKVNQSVKNQKEELNDFIFILENIQEVNNSNMQWKKKQKTINNTIDLTIERMRQKIVELDIDPQY